MNFMPNSRQQPTAVVQEENALLREEVKVARRASEITAELVVEQFVKIEKMLQRLQDSESRYRSLYNETKAREQLYESLLNSTPDAVAICDLHGNTTYINPAFTRMFRFTVEDVRGRPIPFVPDNDAERTGAIVQQVLAGQAVAGWESRRLTKDGEILDVTLSSSCYHDHAGNPMGIVMIFRDVTERKRGEQLLQRERETFFAILQNVPCGVAILTSEGHITFVNRQFVNITGYTSEDIPTLEHWFRVAYPDHRVREEAQTAWYDSESIRTHPKTYTVIRKDGHPKEIQFRRTTLEDGRIIVMLSDITEHIRAEEKIRRAKEEWERTFDAIDDIITIQDKDMRITRMNLAAARFLGADPQQLIGQHCYRLFGEKDQACEDCPGLLTLIDQGPHSAEIEHTWSGKRFLVAISPIFDDNNEFVGIVHAAKDITEKRRIEEELAKAQKLESIGILAGGIAHDFNNILTAILGNISLAKMYADPQDKIYARLAEAEKASLRAKDLTQQLLTFSKGGAPIKRITPIVELIKDAATFALRGSNNLCEFQIREDLYTVEVDEGQISQVINNLVINADQAMPDGGIIRVIADNCTVRPEERLPLQPGRYVRISVIDQGHGIPEQHIKKVFDPYFTTKQKGSGLGLATAFSIINKHDGYIKVESHVNEGSAFHVYLRASEGAMPKRKASVPSPLVGSGKILIMDDEELVRDTLGQMLSHMGYELGFARDGTEAIDLYQQARQSGKPFDAVIMDLTIPGGMGGKEAIGKLRAIDPNVRAIVSSGYSNDPVMSNFRDHGFQGVVSKPYRMEEIQKALVKAILEPY